MADGGGREGGMIPEIYASSVARIRHTLSLPPTVGGRKPPRRFVLDIRGGGASQELGTRQVSNWPIHARSVCRSGQGHSLTPWCLWAPSPNLLPEKASSSSVGLWKQT